MRHATLIAWAALASAQPTAAPRFEAASIKPNPSPSVRHVLAPPTGGRLTARMAPVRLLIQHAYDVQTFQIFGGPGWIDTQGYDLEAKAEGNPTQGEMWRMLQSLLEDRFQLKVHHETREMPVYVLSVAKGGLTLPNAREGDCADAPSTGQKALSDPCAGPVIGAETSGMSLHGKQVTMPGLVKVLAAIMNRPLIDKTSAGGRFDVDLRFAYDGYTAGVPDPRGPESELPSIPVALAKQLGIRLESGRGATDVLVIDRVERPAEN